MNYTHQKSAGAIGLGDRPRQSASQRSRRYDKKTTKITVYSSLCIVPNVKRVGKCEGCHGEGKALVNDFCDLCRSNGANEDQCMHPDQIAAGQRSVTGRKNSARSSWRVRGGR